MYRGSILRVLKSAVVQGGIGSPFDGLAQGKWSSETVGNFMQGGGVVSPDAGRAWDIPREIIFQGRFENSLGMVHNDERGPNIFKGRPETEPEPEGWEMGGVTQHSVRLGIW